MVSTLNRQIAVAPMMDWTDRFCRYFLRLISRETLLYTEMVTTAAILHGDVDYLLQFHPDEHPLALQLGGSDPATLAACAKIAENYGYDEVNLNVGCPSDRVLSGRFGACLMAEPQLVAACVSAMQSAVDIPVTVKTRIGIDDLDSYQHLTHFIDVVAQAGCRVFIIHARKAWLSGLSPKENREIPPLRYDVVHQIKRDFPSLSIVINGGIKTLEEAEYHLQWVDGVMIGREAYSNPYLLATVDQKFYESEVLPQTRDAILDKFLPFLEQQLAKGIALSHMTRHIMGLFQGMPGARLWRRHLSEQAWRKGAGAAVINTARCFLDIA